MVIVYSPASMTMVESFSLLVENISFLFGFLCVKCLIFNGFILGILPA